MIPWMVREELIWLVNTTTEARGHLSAAAQISHCVSGEAAHFHKHIIVKVSMGRTASARHMETFA